MSSDEQVGAVVEPLGFVDQGTSRRGGRQWSLFRNRFLTFTIHHFEEDELDTGEVVMSWTFEFGEFALERDMQVGAGETSMQELYPRYDVKLPIDGATIHAEVERVLGRLRFDLGATDL